MGPTDDTLLRNLDMQGAKALGPVAAQIRLDGPYVLGTIEYQNFKTIIA